MTSTLFLNLGISEAFDGFNHQELDLTIYASEDNKTRIVDKYETADDREAASGHIIATSMDTDQHVFNVNVDNIQVAAENYKEVIGADKEIKSDISNGAGGVLDA